VQDESPITVLDNIVGMQLSHPTHILSVPDVRFAQGIAITVGHLQALSGRLSLLHRQDCRARPGRAIFDRCRDAPQVTLRQFDRERRVINLPEPFGPANIIIFGVSVIPTSPKAPGTRYSRGCINHQSAIYSSRPSGYLL
jgi:hypothetical protein